MVADGWNLRVGAIWGTLLSRHALDRRGVLIEIGPGFQDKIALGLAACQFRGTLYIVEPNTRARRWVAARYRQLLPDARIIAIAQPIPSATGQLPRCVEALLMNHVFDDCLLFAMLPPEDRDRVFAEMRTGHSGHIEVPSRWRRLLDDEGALRAAGGLVVDDVAQLLKQTQPRLLGASQYRSWFQMEHGLARVDHIGAEMLHELELRTGATSVSDGATLRHFGQQPERWLVCERRSRPPGRQQTPGGVT
jgi:hypothetical protein